MKMGKFPKCCLATVTAVLLLLNNLCIAFADAMDNISVIRSIPYNVDKNLTVTGKDVILFEQDDTKYMLIYGSSGITIYNVDDPTVTPSVIAVADDKKAPYYLDNSNTRTPSGVYTTDLMAVYKGADNKDYLFYFYQDNGGSGSTYTSKIRKVDISNILEPQLIATYTWAGTHNTYGIVSILIKNNNLYAFGRSSTSNAGIGAFNAEVTGGTDLAATAYFGTSKSVQTPVTVDGNFVYRAGISSAKLDILVSEINWATNTETAVYTNNIVSVTDSNPTVRNVMVKDGYLYAAMQPSNAEGNRVYVMNVSDKSNISLASTIQPKAYAPARTSWKPFGLAIGSDNILYVGDTGFIAFYAFDVSDKAHPAIAGLSSANYTTAKIVLQGDYLYASGNRAGVASVSGSSFVKNTNGAKPQFYLYNPTENQETGTAITALYKGSRLASVANPYNLTFTAKSIVEVNNANYVHLEPVDGDSSISGYTLKTFIWNSIEQMVPLLNNPFTAAQ